MTKDVTSADRERMNQLLGDRTALQRVMKLNRDHHTAQQLAHMFDEATKEYETYASRAREAARERTARRKAGQARPGDYEGGEAND